MCLVTILIISSHYLSLPCKTDLPFHTYSIKIIRKQPYYIRIYCYNATFLPLPMLFCYCPNKLLIMLTMLSNHITICYTYLSANHFARDRPCLPIITGSLFKLACALLTYLEQQLIPASFLSSNHHRRRITRSAVNTNILVQCAFPCNNQYSTSFTHTISRHTTYHSSITSIIYKCHTTMYKKDGISQHHYNPTKYICVTNHNKLKCNPLTDHKLFRSLPKIILIAYLSNITGYLSAVPSDMLGINA